MSKEKEGQSAGSTRDPFAVLDAIRTVNRADTRPRFRDCPLQIGGEKLRCRRLHFEQLVAMKARFRAVGFKRETSSVNDKQLPELLHLVQISLVPSNDSALRFPGDAGREQLSLLVEPDHIAALGRALCEWNDMFAPDPTVESDEPGPGPKS